MIRLNDIVVKFGDFTALHSINVHVKEGEFFTFLGPSGCGKTTTLRTLTGFIEPVSGTVVVKGKDITHVPIEERSIGIVFQSYALFPTMTVYDNIAFGLKIKKMSKQNIEKKVKDMLKLVGLAGYEDRSIDKLSGGQMQRVAIARALVNEPEVLLLDEPLGALDLKFRKDMQLELKRMQKQLGITFVYVTHDQEEALSMSDTIAVMDEGMIQQIDTPVGIYNEPVNSFVADFIGESNILYGKMRRDYLVAFSGREFECVDRGYNEDENIVVVIRPEDIKLAEPSESTINGVVTSLVFMGVHYEIRIQGEDGHEWLVQSTDPAEVGSRVGITLDPDDIHIMDRSQYDAADA